MNESPTLEDIIRDRTKSWIERQRVEPFEGRVVADIILDRNLKPTQKKGEGDYVMTVDLRTKRMKRVDW